MAKLTTTSYVMLGLLTSRDWSAYELAEQVGRGLADLWSRADRQRYEAPKKLVALGLATARTEHHGRRARTVYSITPAGRKALSAWLADQPRPLTIEFEGMVRVLVADEGTVEDLRRTLAAIETEAQAGIDRYVAYARFLIATGGTFPDRKHTFALANRFMVGHFTHLRDWARWAQAETADWPDTDTIVESHAERLDQVLLASIAQVEDAS